MGKRKRSGKAPTQHATSKRTRLGSSEAASALKSDNAVLQPLLNHCYHEVKSLKRYLLDALPSSSRNRRRRIESFEEEKPNHRKLLNGTLVGLLTNVSPAVRASRLQQLDHFTQTQRSDPMLSATTQRCSVDEVLQFVIWSLFQHQDPDRKKPNHILCHGLERSITNARSKLDHVKPIMPGVLQRHDNVCVDTLKGPLWRQVMALAGADAESIFINLFLDCGLFLPLGHDTGSYYQLSGVPVHDLCLQRGTNKQQELTRGAKEGARKLSEINIVRNRMYYSKPSLNRNDLVSFGLKHIHVLKRLQDTASEVQNLMVMQYVFPRQFHLHNVFTSTIDKNETAQLFKDYTFRDDTASLDAQPHQAVPRRLRGRIAHFIRKLRKNQRSCPYDQLIAHYCPAYRGRRFVQGKLSDHEHSTRQLPKSSAALRTQNSIAPTAGQVTEMSSDENDNRETAFVPYATSEQSVSSFCKAALFHILPRDTFGKGEDGIHNSKMILRHIDRFVWMRKYETINMHELVQGLRLKSITWLAPKSMKSATKLAVTDKNKRAELLNELIYYLFDSLLVPLIAANFYVTESGIHRNKLIYFRHDVWLRLCQPCLASARLGSIVAVSNKQVRKRFSKPDALGYSLIRLLPKDSGTRSITNLRRRTLKTINGKRVLAPSINSRLTPVFNIFNFERKNNEGIFRSDSLSMQDLHHKLSSFRDQFGATIPQLHFVKVDIRSAFDSIPQIKLLDLVRHLFKHDEYFTTKHAETKLLGCKDSARASVKFVKAAKSLDCSFGLGISDDLAMPRRMIVYSDADQYQDVTKHQAEKLLEEHLRGNIVKVGNKYHMQSQGIPQGSILSSLLCTFFYNDFERTRLRFLNPRTSLLLRILDDFLLITSSQQEAVRFVHAMKEGDTSYGIFIHPEKSLVNFDVAINEVQIPKLLNSSSFPFCGLYIDTKTLLVSKDRVRKDNVVANTLTVDLHGHAGEKFKRRILSSLRIQLQSILLDTNLSSRLRILQTLIECFQETTMKMHQYYMALPLMKRPAQDLLIKLVEQLIRLVVEVVKKQQVVDKEGVSRAQVCALAAAGISRVLESRSTPYRQLLAWLRRLRTQTEHSIGAETLAYLVLKSTNSVEHYIY